MFVGCFCGRSLIFFGMLVGCFVVECGYFAECSPHYSNSSVALWQGTSSCREPIYRARIYVCTHVMGDGNACVVK